MLNPNETNRERLLRLIDGGPEVVKEVQEERKPAAAESKPATVTPVTQVPQTKKPDVLDAAAKWLARVQWDAATLAKIVVVFVLLILALRSASDLVKAFKKPGPVPAAQTAVPALSDDSGIGVRLVGVDWGDPPVALLEDLKTGKTYFAHKSDKIKGVSVKEIFKNKVTVVAGGKTLELR